MLKFAVIFLIVSLVAGAIGLSGISQVARRVSLVLFALFFLVSLRSSAPPISWAMPLPPAPMPPCWRPSLTPEA